MNQIRLQSPDEATTRQLGADISLILMKGDVLALSGDLGVGKSTFARGLIACLLQDEDQEISSPTYTICNNYPSEPPVFHFDFYRISGPEELEELGFDDAVEAGICLVEWPQNGFVNLPGSSVLIEISDTGESSRDIVISGSPDLMARIQRTIEIRDFLDKNGFSNAARFRRNGDASARRYESVSIKTGQSFLLMDSPDMPDGPPVRNGLPYSKIAHIAERVDAFVAIDTLLRERNLAAPEIPAVSLTSGLLVVENLGSDQIIDENRQPIPERYIASIEFLDQLHSATFPDKVRLDNTCVYSIPAYDHEALRIETELLLDWFIPEVNEPSLSSAKQDEFREIWSELFELLDDQPKTLVLRDFHSPNIIWRGEHSGTDRIGVIDFQDAVIGPTAYDLASIAQDARVDVPAELEEKLVGKYMELRTATDPNFDIEVFRTGYAIMAAQRATKILGIFCRLNKRDGKPQYLAHLPRIQDYLRRSLNHPVLERYRTWLHAVMNL